MKMPVNVRTAFRRMLRNHPRILDLVPKKSEINNLTRDELIRLADLLDIDFLQSLGTAGLWDLEMEREGSRHFLPPFEGEVKFPISIGAFGEASKVMFRVAYQFTPEWQYFCPHQKRLKYRRASSKMSLAFESVDREWHDDGTWTEIREWKEGSDLIWALLNPTVVPALDDEIERQAWKLDQERRAAAGIPPGDPTNALVLLENEGFS